MNSLGNLWAGPYVGEFGWELFHWQGWLRKQAKKFDKVFVGCREGHELLYQDFASEIILFQNIGYNTDCEKEASFVYKDEHLEIAKQYNIEFDYILKPWEVSHFMPTLEDQEFIPFAAPIQPKYLVLHARWTNKWGTGYRNWNIENWTKVVDHFRVNHIIYSIGTSDAALHLPNTIDFRNVPLWQLADLFNYTKVLIGPSSGPMHFGSLSSVPHISWGGPPRNKPRYEKNWNPLGTPVTFIEPNPGGGFSEPESWNANVDEVINAIEAML